MPDAGEMHAGCIRRFRQQHSLPVLNARKGVARQQRAKDRAGDQAGGCRLLNIELMGLPDALYRDGRMPINNTILEREIRVFELRERTVYSPAARVVDACGLRWPRFSRPPCADRRTLF